MIVERILQLYEQDKRRRPSTGYPTGSRFGNCAAALQMLRRPDLSRPEPPPPRAIMRWDRGDRAERWLAEKLEQAYPGLTGLRQEVFYFEVPLPEPSMVDAVQGQIESAWGSNSNLWGTVLRKFQPPTIRLGDDGRVKIRPLSNKKMGFVLDLSRGSVWAPTYIDFAIVHPELGLAIIEVKSVSNFAFRRAILGQLDYQKRCQLVGMAEATGAAILFIAHRAETEHLAEIAYTPTVERVRVTLTKMNGQTETFFALNGGLTAVDGAARDVPGDELWDLAHVWTPYEPGLVAEIQARIRRVLLNEPGQWHREYGPSFVCQTCEGTGTQTLAKQGRTLLKKPKPCEDCRATGLRDEAELTFPCSWCPCVQSVCYPFVKLTVDSKPHYRITRADWEAAGLTFAPPSE